MPKKRQPPQATEPPARLARALAAAMPPPKESQARTVRVMIVLSEDETEQLRFAAAQRGEPLAAAIRNLAVTAARLLAGSA